MIEFRAGWLVVLVTGMWFGGSAFVWLLHRHPGYAWIAVVATVALEYVSIWRGMKP